MSHITVVARKTAWLQDLGATTVGAAYEPHHLGCHSPMIVLDRRSQYVFDGQVKMCLTGGRIVSNATRYFGVKAQNSVKETP